MEEANFKYYEIDLADIWIYEREEFIAGNTEKRKAQRNLDLVQMYVAKYANPCFGEEMIRHSRDYYFKNLDEYINADLNKRYFLESFFQNNNCYEYRQSILLPKEESDFNYFFALKLRQYKDNLFEVENFLKYQSSKDEYKQNLSKFRTFIETLILQYTTLFAANLNTHLKRLLVDSELFKDNSIVESKAVEKKPTVWQWALFYVYVMDSNEHPSLKELAETHEKAFGILSLRHKISSKKLEQCYNFYYKRSNRISLSKDRTLKTVAIDIAFVIDELLPKYPKGQVTAQNDLEAINPKYR
jgi:hypothetical protein